MLRKILVLNGSPRRAGNTSCMIREFTRGAKESGHIVTTFFLDEMNINGCKGCFKGGKDICSPCVQKDDMEKIFPVYKEADIVVLASPLYYWSISGQLKVTIDRLFATVESQSEYVSQQKFSILIVAAEGYDFEDVVAYYVALLKHLKWNDIGQVLAGGVKYIGDIEGNSGLLKAYELGTMIE